MAAELYIELNLSIDGAAVAADALPVMTDDAGAYGVKRLDTGAVVVAAGTPMTAVAGVVGRYRFTIASPIPGVQYAYAARATYLGRPYPFTGERGLPAAVAGLPSYHTVATADALAAQLFGVLAYAGASSEDKAKALPTASARVDASDRWQGCKIVPTQTLEFPRFDGPAHVARLLASQPPSLAGIMRGCGGGRFIDADPDTGLPTVPTQVLIATVYEADSLLAGSRADRVNARHDGLTSQTLGDASESYTPPVGPNGVPMLCANAAACVLRYRLSSGRLR